MPRAPPPPWQNRALTGRSVVQNISPETRVQKALETARTESDGFAARVSELTEAAMKARRELSVAEIKAEQLASDMSVQKQHRARLEAALSDAEAVATAAQERLERALSATKARSPPAVSPRLLRAPCLPACRLA